MKNIILRVLKESPNGYSKILKSTHRDIYNLIDNLPGKTFPEKLYRYLYNPQPRCMVCASETRFVNINLGFKKFCSIGCNQEYRKQNSTSHKKLAEQVTDPPACHNFSCNNPVLCNKAGAWLKFCSRQCRGQFNSKSSRHKAKDTLRKKYGVDHPRKSKDINDKMVLGLMKKYGVDNVAKLDWVQEKIKATCEERYGSSNGGIMNRYCQNTQLENLRSRESLDYLFSTFSVDEIAKKLSVHPYTVYRYLHEHNLISRYKSSFEREVAAYIQSLGFTSIIENDRRILKGRELDIVIEEKKIAIECNGLYWHHDSIDRIDRNYHRQKFLDCEQAGYQLITIFDDVWNHKKDIVRKALQAKLGASSTSIYARTCTIQKMSIAETRVILEANHIQGYTPAQIAYGLYHDNELVACMTFSKPRLGIGRRKNEDNTYELVRYVSSKRVLGGASKLIKRFISDHQPIKIISYSDNEWSNGHMYRTLGFTLESDQVAGYSYVSPSCAKREHRFRYAKYRLVAEGFDRNKTETEIMRDRGYLRIWDCGKRTWVLTCR